MNWDVFAWIMIFIFGFVGGQLFIRGLVIELTFKGNPISQKTITTILFCTTIASLCAGFIWR